METEKIEKIIQYYDERVNKYGTSSEATLLDYNMREIEIETVKHWMKNNDRILDIFCGNGNTTVALSNYCKDISGIDLSEKMIESANKLLENNKDVTNVKFDRGNILDLGKIYKKGQFDIVTSIRGLINLPTWELQKQAIINVHNLLPDGGKFIFIEGSKDGLDKINELRKKYNLSEIKEPWYDKNFETARLLAFIEDYFELQDEKNLDIYFLISRVLYPAAIYPENPKFDSICNKIARMSVPYVEANTGTTLLICKCFKKK